MRAMIAVAIAATVLWSGYWFVGSRGVENGLRAWLDGRDAAGWVANYDQVRTRGFPNRFDTTITGLELADPATGIAWTAPFFQILRLSYQPDHQIVIWPESQTLASPLQRVTVDTEDARASLVFVPGTAFELERLTAVARNVRLASDAGWTARIADWRLATRPSETAPGQTDVALDLQQLRPANAALGQLAAAGIVPGVVDRLQVDATLAFDAPWDRAAIETRRPAVTEIDLNLLQVDWGELELWAAGELTLDRAGLATGSITVKARNWREMLQVAVASGWIGEGLAGTLETGLSVLAGLSGSPRTLDAPLRFESGQVSFGPIPLGKLGPLRIR